MDSFQNINMLKDYMIDPLYRNGSYRSDARYSMNVDIMGRSYAKNLVGVREYTIMARRNVMISFMTTMNAYGSYNDCIYLGDLTVSYENDKTLSGKRDGCINDYNIPLVVLNILCSMCRDRIDMCSRKALDGEFNSCDIYLAALSAARMLMTSSIYKTYEESRLLQDSIVRDPIETKKRRI